MTVCIKNANFDPSTDEIVVDVEGRAPVWINLDCLIAQYHGAGMPTKESISIAIGKWILEQHRRDKGRRIESEAAMDAVGSLKGTVLAA